MSTAYPLASTGDDALKTPGELARTRYAADALANDHAILGLETDWITVSADAKDALMKAADAGRSAGYIQLYENSDGSPVLAVTYWKLQKISKPAPKPKPKKKTPQEADTTDDLYFRRGRTKPYSRKKKPDPNQLDLFAAPIKDDQAD